MQARDQQRIWLQKLAVNKLVPISITYISNSAAIYDNSIFRIWEE